MTKSYFTEEKGKRVVELRQQGLLWREIGKKMRVSDKAAQNWAVKVGMDLRTSEMKPTVPHTNGNGKAKGSTGNGKAVVMRAKGRVDLRDVLAGTVTPQAPTLPPSKKEVLKTWLAKNPDGTSEQFTKDTKVSMHQTYFNHVKRMVEGRKPGKKRGSRKGKTTARKGKKPSFSSTVQSKLQALEEENAFLKWCNLGERRGWVDRLLKEIQE